MSLPATQTLVPFRKPGRRHGFPVARPLVGRSEDLSRAVVELGPGAIVTLLGPPGIGKTSLAVWVAERFAGDRSAWFCDLGEARTEADLVAAVLAALGEPAGEDDRVADALRERGSSLVVLDNFEPLVASASRLLDWAAGTPETAWLVTSRERLAIDGERVVELEPLTLPAAGSSSEAVELFLQRARDAGGHGLEQREAVEELVRALDGIPLAIELAAARTRLMSPRVLADRIRGDLLALGKRGSPRHRTLAAAIAWSWELLDDAERRALAACSVFASGFRVDDVEAVLTEAGIDHALELVSALRDKSLIHRVGVDRLGLYSSIRAFAGARLADHDPGWVDAVRSAHAARYADLAERLARTRLLVLRGADAHLPGDVRRDTAQMGVALDALVAGEGRDDPERRRWAASLAAALALVGGRAPEELEPMLARSPGAVAALARHRALRAMGRLDDGYAQLEAVVAMEGVEAGLKAMARVLAGVQRRAEGDGASARALHDRAQQDIDPVAMPVLHGVNLACRGRLACDAGDVARARQLNQEAGQHQERLGESWLAALSLANLAQLEQDHGRFERAESLLERAIERFRQAGEPEYETIYAAVCAGLYLEWGKLELARPWFEAAQGPLDGLSLAVPRILVSGGRAVLRAFEGDDALAREHLERARREADRSPCALTRVLTARYAAAVEIALGRMSDSDRRDWEHRLQEQAAAGEEARVARDNVDARFAGRLVALALRRTRDESALTVTAGARSFARGGDAVDLSRRGAPRRILEALVNAHRGDGRALDVPALAEAGWPGERILVEAAATRVRVAIATLRKLGLRDVLLTRDEGYLLDPDVTVVVE